MLRKCFSHAGQVCVFHFNFIKVYFNHFRKVVCLIVNAITGKSAVYWSLFSFATLLIAAIIYAYIGFYVKKNSQTTKATSRLLKSLIIITVWTLCSWMWGYLVQIFTTIVTLKNEITFLILLYSGIPIHMACSLDLFVLYVCRYK